MHDDKPRSRMISLRISQIEYETMCRQYRSYGARSVSDFARLAMQRIMAQAAAADPHLRAKIVELEDRLAAVEEHLSHVVEKAGAVS